MRRSRRISHCDVSPKRLKQSSSVDIELRARKSTGKTFTNILTETQLNLMCISDQKLSSYLLRSSIDGVNDGKIQYRINNSENSIEFDLSPKFSKSATDLPLVSEAYLNKPSIENKLVIVETEPVLNQVITLSDAATEIGKEIQLVDKSVTNMPTRLTRRSAGVVQETIKQVIPPPDNCDEKLTSIQEKLSPVVREASSEASLLIDGDNVITDMTAVTSGHIVDNKSISEVCLIVLSFIIFAKLNVF